MTADVRESSLACYLPGAPTYGTFSWLFSGGRRPNCQSWHPRDGVAGLRDAHFFPLRQQYFAFRFLTKHPISDRALWWCENTLGMKHQVYGQSLGIKQEWGKETCAFGKRPPSLSQLEATDGEVELGKSYAFPAHSWSLAYQDST